ncbi:16S rRNA (guanine(527)-N(7))-methyltransferase RsmG [Spiroplasma tabanidicola]|uniref:Ribosomal RNA small subunit methyltransferase G n=1 Tax=Spiroplasma tabanidicola TaxID=324079 RepID=A0A6I6CBS5_9MOLU|nr:16S rRNA (guanine(527)-N(7))-methyltransferase RsmG [Spiroplasma tabanidicola]QGS52441.1 16S rRNA (guanine527-N7)-methyltransferase [Spiroplasma tabanidicola]
MWDWSKIEEYIGCLSEEKKSLLITYKELLQEENQKYNLTTIIDDQEIYLKHFIDSVLFIKEFEINNQKIMDIGTGAGFPGLVIKILFPDTSVFLVESNNKKINFLNLVINKLGLKNIYTVNKRAEEYSTETKEQFDIVISRAMAPLNILLEVGVQAIKIKGHFICLKAKNVFQEITQLNGKEHLIGLKLIKEQNLLIENIGERINLFYEKVTKTNDNYPRLYSQIKKKPLGS